ncbi:hypothetical protein Geob_2077 [Geotalea daltonii FRC-32]|uniref:Uncharacterized protein n=1 Tax=Geotalea daltonii (strain DSM 22248 / JCM 15807 / FRC-32) TaxID=316067 RepID=B9M8T6_GEODF|nr:hypothetical protein [Geotalea daltonii]ACM20432.1 hypothetical protein Geob_2077 [Geotalea daltonii FRC-32]
MAEFEPSPHFVHRVMVAVRAEARQPIPERLPALLLSAPLRWSLAVGGSVLTLVNLFRMIGSFFAPSFCG